MREGRDGTVRLGEIAYARSGDKGSGANIGVIARDPAHWDMLRAQVTAERVAAFFAPLEPGEVRRYELPLLQALNFVLPGVLAGGGSRNLRIDAQGKALGQVLLEMEVGVGSGAQPAGAADCGTQVGKFAW